MKRILATTDFSQTANNAVRYAAELAQAAYASLTVLNVYHVPLMVSDVPAPIVIGPDDMEKESMQELRNLVIDIQRDVPSVKISVDSRAGFAQDEINELSKKSGYDLVVMGIEGHGRAVQFLGSTATGVARDAKVPVLIVPDGAKFKKPERIVFAFDYKEISDTNKINMLLELADLFKSRIHVLNVVGEVKEIYLERALAGMQVDDILYNTKHELSIPEDADAVHGIEEYLKRNESDMLVMIKRQHSLFERLFYTNHTKKMAFQTHIPLLVLHD